MKKFILTLLYFVVPLVIAPIILDKAITSTLKKSRNGDFAVWNDLFDGKINSDIIIYGSSRAWININPKIIEENLNTSAYNLGIDGHNFLLQYCRHKILLKYNKKPRIIILSLDNYTFDKRVDLYNPQQFLPYMHEPIIKDTIDKYVGYSFLDYNIPLIRYFGAKEASLIAFKMLLFPFLNTETRYKGFQGQSIGWTGDLERANKTSNNKFVQNLDNNTIELFERFLQETIAMGIKIIFVYTPEYIEGQTFVSNRSDFFSLFHKFSRKYNIPFYDYSGDPISYNREYFYNSQHLNAIGADLFTRKLTVEALEW
jgi:hypothetical protein